MDLWAYIRNGWMENGGKGWSQEQGFGWEGRQDKRDETVGVDETAARGTAAMMRKEGLSG